jgi:transcriptional regulator with XRE-family HTH domain
MFKFVGETLRRLRKERGKTLEQLGEEAGLGRGQLSRIENSRQESTLTTLAKILASQGVSRRDFFHRYDLVEAEALAVGRTAAGARPPSGGSSPANPGDWPEEIREVLGKLESFVDMTFHQPRPVAQGAIEFGDLVILFRVVPKSAPEAQAAEATPLTDPIAPRSPEPEAPAPPEPVSAPKPSGRKKKR